MLTIHRRDAENAEMKLNKMTPISISEADMKYMNLALNVSPTITKENSATSAALR